ncbi:MAG: sulfatase [Candidatus Aminicenantaceae bacterium]
MKKQNIEHIILIYLDALRADHLSCYGYHRNTTPNIDSLAKKGVLFKNTFSQGSSTFPSVHSALTSKYASHFFTKNKKKLSDEELTLAEVLKKNGYYTAGFSSNPLITKTETRYSLGGFEQGFYMYDDSVYQGEKWNWQWRSPEGIIENALAWLEQNHGKKFFLLLYVMDPHCRYDSPEPYNSMYDPDYTGKNKYIIQGNPSFFEFYILKGTEVDLNERDIFHLISLYDGEITYADAQIGRLINKLQKLNLAKKTLIVLTSDHGEEFFEHGGVKHGYTLYNEAIKVPLIMMCPSCLPKNKKVDEIVQSLDIVPTILDIAKIKKPKVMQGESLLPLIKGKKSRWRSYAISETPFVDAKAIITKQWKYIHHFESRPLRPDICNKYKKGKELFNLEKDPEERINLYEKNPTVTKELFLLLLSLMPSSETERLKLGKDIKLDKKTLDRLKSLGYLK